MQIDEKDPNAVTVRPTPLTLGAETRWFRDKDPGSGITGTSLLARFFNDVLGNLRALLAAAGVVRTTTGPGGDNDLLNAILNLLAARTQRGTLHGSFEYVSASQVRLRPRLGTRIAIEIDDVVYQKAVDLVFDHALDFSGSETASSPVYYYVHWDPAGDGGAGDFVPHATHTSPHLPGGAKPGYHPTNTTWRCVGTAWNGPGSDLVPFTLRRGRHTFRERVADHYHTLTMTFGGWLDLALNVPDGAGAVSLLVLLRGDDPRVAFGTSDAPGSLPTTETVPHSLNDANMQGVLAIAGNETSSNISTSGGPTQTTQTLQIDLPIADLASPGIRYGALDEGAAGASNAEMKVIAYDDPFAPQT